MKKRKNHLGRHHLCPKERFKLHTEYQNQVRENFSRVLMLWRDKHNSWHHLFHNLTLHEIIELLQRIEQIKYH